MHLKKGNWWIGTGDVGKGPTNVTGFYNGLDTPSGGYTIYLNKATQGPAIYNCANDSEFLGMANLVNPAEIINLSIPFNQWYVRRSINFEVTDGSISPPFTGSKVWSLTVDDAIYGNRLHRNWPQGANNGIIGDLGNSNYRYYMWVRGDSNNSSNASIYIDISDGNNDVITVGNTTAWNLLSVIDGPERSYNASKFFDLYLNGDDGNTFYISSNAIVRLNESDPNDLRPVFEFPGYMDYNEVKKETYSGNEVFSWVNSQDDMLVLNRDVESIITDGLVLNLDAGLVASYPKQNKSWIDLSSGQESTLANSPFYSSTAGGTITFDGVDDYVTQPYDLIGSTDFTISIWARCSIDRTQLSATRYSALAGYASGGSYLRYDVYPSTDTSDRSISLLFWAAGPNTFVSTNMPDSFDLNDWHLYTYTRNTTSQKIYVDGVLEKTSTFSNSNTLTTNYTNIGEYANSHWEGDISIFSIYNRQISDDDVLRNYNAQKSRFGL